VVFLAGFTAITASGATGNSGNGRRAIAVASSSDVLNRGNTVATTALPCTDG
jgi:hypothetical protein